MWCIEIDPPNNCKVVFSFVEVVEVDFYLSIFLIVQKEKMTRVAAKNRLFFRRNSKISDLEGGQEKPSTLSTAGEDVVEASAEAARACEEGESQRTTPGRASGRAALSRSPPCEDASTSSRGAPSLSSRFRDIIGGLAAKKYHSDHYLSANSITSADHHLGVAHLQSQQVSNQSVERAGRILTVISFLSPFLVWKYIKELAGKHTMDIAKRRNSRREGRGRAGRAGGAARRGAEGGAARAHPRTRRVSRTDSLPRYSTNPIAQHQDDEDAASTASAAAAAGPFRSRATMMPHVEAGIIQDAGFVAQGGSGLEDDWRTTSTSTASSTSSLLSRSSALTGQQEQLLISRGGSTESTSLRSTSGLGTRGSSRSGTTPSMSSSGASSVVSRGSSSFATPLRGRLPSQ
ncbi:unnamed protein product [Amoebophrya sp. A25]|nr:unnamed protein product [Amoebophrya sp. A25]|eukprot:GSA25T00017736001.1